jgi:hypothetical protein
VQSNHGGVRRASLVVGREVELDRLLRAVPEVRAGGTGCVFVVGEGGVGKTRLLAEIATESRQLGLAVLTGRAPVTTPVAFSVVAEALRSWQRVQPDVLPLPPFDPGLRLVLPEWPGEPSVSAGLSDAQLRLLALEGVVRLVQRIADTNGAALVLLDDCTRPTPRASRPLATSRTRRHAVYCWWARCDPTRARSPNESRAACSATAWRTCSISSRSDGARSATSSPRSSTASRPVSWSTTCARAPTVYRCSSRSCSRRICVRDP